jgi:hypothetical protein
MNHDLASDEPPFEDGAVFDLPEEAMKLYVCWGTTLVIRLKERGGA